MRILNYLILFVLLLVQTACQIRNQGYLSYLPGNLDTEGKSFVAHCNSCHAAPHPARHTVSEWKNVYRQMQLRMQERGYTLPPEAERDAILQYLTRYAR